MSNTLSTPTIGLIVPPAEGLVPPEACMYPEINFIAEGLALASVDPKGYDQVIDLVLEKAQKLVARGAQAVSLMGTSLSFYRGNEKNELLVKSMQIATGVPCSTMSHAIVKGLKAFNINRLVVATSYIDVVNEHLKTFLINEGFNVLSCKGLGETGVEAMAKITTQDLVDLCLSVYEENTDQAEGILLSCGGLRSLDAIREVEARIGLPVIASSPAGFWDAVSLLNKQTPRQGLGKLAQM